MTSANDNGYDRLVLLIGEEIRREKSAKRDKYGGLRALCQAACDLPVYPPLSKKDEEKLRSWQMKITKELTNKQSPGALKIAELKRNMRAKRDEADQNKAITVVELINHVPQIVAILNTYLNTFYEKHPNLLFWCIKLFVFLAFQLIVGPVVPLLLTFS